MSNTITAYFKGRVGVAESVYQNDYGIVMEFDSIVLPTHFDCYFSKLNQEEAVPAIGADNRVVIPNSILADPGNMTIHIPLHTGESDSEVEYVIYFKVIGRARPIDDGTPAQMTAIERALALLSQPITNIEEIVNEALSFTGDTFDEMQAKLDADQAEFEDEMQSKQAEFESEINSDFEQLNSQFNNLATNVKANSVNTLWTGTLKAKNDSATLSESVANFDYIDIYTGSTDNRCVRKKVSDLSSVVKIQGQNLYDMSGAYGLAESEIHLSISGTTATIVKTINFSWNGEADQAADSSADSYDVECPIIRIDGVKIGSHESAELTDIRVGADGITYNSAGAAVRGQLSDLKSEIVNVKSGNYVHALVGNDIEQRLEFDLDDYYSTILVANTNILYTAGVTSFYIGCLDANGTLLQDLERKYGDYASNEKIYKAVAGTKKIRIVAHSTQQVTITVTFYSKNSISSLANLINNDVIDYAVKPIRTKNIWFEGAFSAYDGTVVGSTTRVHANDLKNAYRIICENGYSVLLYGWDSNNVYQGYLVGETFQKTGAVWKSEYNLQEILQMFPNYTLKVALRKNDDSNIIVNDICDVVTVEYSYEKSKKVLAEKYELTPANSPIFFDANGLLPSALICDFKSYLDKTYDLQCCTSDNDGNVYVGCSKDGVGYVLKIAPSGKVVANTKSNFMLHGISASYDSVNQKLILSSREGITRDDDRNCYIYDFETNSIEQTFEYPTISNQVGMFVYKLDTDKYLMLYSDLQTTATLYAYIYDSTLSTMELVSDIETEFTYLQDADVVGDYVYCILNNANASRGEILIFDWQVGERIAGITTMFAEVEGCSIRIINDSVYLLHCDNTHNCLRKLKIK